MTLPITFEPASDVAGMGCMAIYRLGNPSLCSAYSFAELRASAGSGAQQFLGSAVRVNFGQHTTDEAKAENSVGRESGGPQGSKMGSERLTSAVQIKRCRYCGEPPTEFDPAWRGVCSGCRRDL